MDKLGPAYVGMVLDQLQDHLMDETTGGPLFMQCWADGMDALSIQPLDIRAADDDESE